MTLARESRHHYDTVSPVDVDSKLALTTIQYPAELKYEPIWTPQISEMLDALVHEWTHSDKLFDAGLSPSRTVLLSGPPGVGKTMAATFLAQRLGLPLITLNLAAAMNSFLGKTGNNLTKVLVHAQQRPCILLLDEFDALAKRRDDNQDVGELKRIVNVLLQAIDEWPSTAMLIAATNHEELLDRALFRRFDLWIRFPEGTIDQIVAILISQGCDPALAKSLAPDFLGQPLSNVTRLLQRAKRRAALYEAPLESAINDVVSVEFPDRLFPSRDKEVLRLKGEGKSTRTIGKQLGISAATVSRVLNRPTQE